MTFVIEENIPIPAAKRGPNGKYPFGEMKVWDSFWSCEKASILSAAARTYGKRKSKKFITRVETKGGIKGIRVWRVE